MITILKDFDSLSTEDQFTFLSFAKAHHITRVGLDAYQRDGFISVGDSEPALSVVTPFVDVTNQPNLSEQARKVRADKGQRLSDERMRCRYVERHEVFGTGGRCINRSGGPRSKFLCQEHAK